MKYSEEELTEEELLLKELSAMQIIDFKKLGFINGKETIDKVLELITHKQKIIKSKERVIKSQKEYIKNLEEYIKELGGEI